MTSVVQGTDGQPGGKGAVSPLWVAFPGYEGAAPLLQAQKQFCYSSRGHLQQDPDE